MLPLRLGLASFAFASTLLSTTIARAYEVDGCVCPESGSCGNESYGDVPADGTFYVTTFTGGGMSCGGTADGTWPYVADLERFGCGAKLLISANGKSCVAQVADCGPNKCVEDAASFSGCTGHFPIIDASPMITEYLFGIGSSGWSDRRKIHVEQVAGNTPIGCPSAPVCSPHCEGNVRVDSHCEKAPCGAGEGCADDAPGLRCVVPFCPVDGDASVCEPSVAKLAHCHDGEIASEDDCGAKGGVCSTKSGDHCDEPPRGYLDTVTCDSLGGWAQDPDAKDTALEVHVTFDGARGDPNVVDVAIDASNHRDDLCSAIGSCNHGFSMRTPRSLLDGKPHAIHAYALDVTGGPDAELSASPATLRCDPPAIPGPPMVLRRVLNDASFSNWRFSSFFDVAPEEDALSRLGLPASTFGVAMPSGPELAMADDGSPDVWVIDGGERRHVVDEASFQAWRFQAPTAWLATKLYELPKGPDFPALPLLVEALGPEGLVIDVGFGASSSPVTTPSGGAGGAPPNADGDATTNAGASGIGGASGANDVAMPSDDATDESSSACAIGEREGRGTPTFTAWLAIVFAAEFCRRRRI